MSVKNINIKFYFHIWKIFFLHQIFLRLKHVFNVWTYGILL